MCLTLPLSLVGYVKHWAVNTVLVAASAVETVELLEAGQPQCHAALIEAGEQQSGSTDMRHTATQRDASSNADRVSETNQPHSCDVTPAQVTLRDCTYEVKLKPVVLAVLGRGLVDPWTVVPWIWNRDVSSGCARQCVRVL